MTGVYSSGLECDVNIGLQVYLSGHLIYNKFNVNHVCDVQCSVEFGDHFFTSLQYPENLLVDEKIVFH